MRIETVTISGLRGQAATHDLAPVTVLAGPNGSGKSAALEAIARAIQGTKGRAHQQVIEQAPAGEDVVVDLALEGGTIRRAWRRTKRGGVKAEWHSALTPGGSEEEAAAVFGPLGYLDAHQVAAMTASEWRGQLLALLSGRDAGVDLSDLPDRLKPATDLPPVEALQEASAKVGEWAREAQAALQRLRKTAETMAADGGAAVSQAKVDEAAKARTAAEEEYRRLSDEMADAQAAAREARERTARIERLRDRAQAATADLASIEREVGEAHRRYEQRVEAAEGSKDAARDAREEERAARAEAQRRAEELGAAKAKLRGLIEALEHGTCPTCHQEVGEEVGADRVATEELIARIEESGEAARQTAQTAAKEAQEWELAARETQRAQEDLRVVEGRLKDARKIAEQAREDLAREEAAEQAPQELPDLEVLRAQVEAAEQAMRAARDRATDLAGQAEAAKARARATEALQEAQEERDEAKRWREELAIREAALIASLMEPLRDACQLAGEALGLPVTWGGLDPLVDGHPWATLSTGERAIWWTAMLAGIHGLEGEERPDRCRLLLLDNLEALDPDHQRTLGGLLLQLLERGLLHQVVAAHAGEEVPAIMESWSAEPDSGARLIWLGLDQGEPTEVVG